MHSDHMIIAWHHDPLTGTLSAADYPIYDYPAKDYSTRSKVDWEAARIRLPNGLGVAVAEVGGWFA